MSALSVISIVIVVIVAAGAAGYLAWSRGRRRHLQEIFGPEYDHAVQKYDGTRQAEQELLARRKRHERLQIRELDSAARVRHRAEWRQVQEDFVDAPKNAVSQAERLLLRIMSERGYPTDDYEQQVSDLSVEHAGSIGRYRAAHDIGMKSEADQASTEDLRQAMVHYHTLLTELLGGQDAARTAADTTPAERTHMDSEAEKDSEGTTSPTVVPTHAPHAGEPYGPDAYGRAGTDRTDLTDADRTDQTSAAEIRASTDQEGRR